MLASLSIRDVVLIDRLQLAFDRDLGVLTGETGAGKSILLDALGLALGERAEAGLVRQGTDKAQVTAAFELEPRHPAFTLLADNEIDVEEDLLVLRRVLGSDGRSRAYINDQAVSIGLLRKLGDLLVEVQGQFAQRGLMDPKTHLMLLDAYGGLETEAAELARLHGAWRGAVKAQADAEAAFAQARTDEAFLRHAVEELSQLAAQPGEEEKLGEERSFLMNAEKLVTAINASGEELSGGESALARALRQLEEAAPKAGGRLDSIVAAVERAVAEAGEAAADLASVSAGLEVEPDRLQEIDERFFALKDAARKHGCEAEDLPDLLTRMEEQLAGIETGGERLNELAQAQRAARGAYAAAAEALSAARQRAAAKLDKAVNAELPPLKLEKARFATEIAPLDEDTWGRHGKDAVSFRIATNPGALPGPLARIASGGELSRILLALKVVLAEISPIVTLVFDEVDSGIGGATAAAVGERLARLADGRQVLVVTHSPQVAARGATHYLVRKDSRGKQTTTGVAQLDGGQRREEVARMLSGATVTDEARAAAEKLMGAA
ncbi:DNA repair protein RecN [Algihabitans albus]|uniref:DNA repair protein RecN n=1 Tax=Algihabitans albus TaxID=2164067 RepID=UPI000E5D160C|nr:DNA repair protein RecN [Algihabitans albus]